MSQYWETGEVKARLANLFKAELGFVKSANLAGEMVTRHWYRSVGDNADQRALSILASTLRALLTQDPDSSESATVLWCHQKATSKHRSWFFSIGTGLEDILAAAEWLLSKAVVFAEQTEQSNFFASIWPPREEAQ